MGLHTRVKMVYLRGKMLCIHHQCSVYYSRNKVMKDELPLLLFYWYFFLHEKELFFISRFMVVGTYLQKLFEVFFFIEQISLT